ncbi:hypothetical protein KBD49_01630 [Myxococcota bacterium]|nr:hypothetical protein [Myxococcota bacterium]
MSRERPWVAPLVEALFVSLGLLAVFVFSFRPNWDIDIFWHVATGRWIVEHGALPHTDIFSASDPSRPWTPFQWLYEVAMAELESRTSFTGIRVIHAFLFTATFALWWWWFRRILRSRITAAVLWSLALVISLDRFRVRPEAFNFFFLALTLPLFPLWPSRFPRPSPRTRAVLLALIGALWANLHAGGALWLPLSLAAVAAGALLAWLPDRSSPDLRRDLREAGWLFLVALVPMIPMPGFLKGVHQAFAMYQESMILIPEWHPPAAYFHPAFGGRLTPAHAVCGAFPYLLLLAIALVTIHGLVRHGWRDFLRRYRVGMLALAWLNALMAARTARFLYLDVIALAALLASRDRWPAPRWTGRLGGPVAGMIAVTLMGMLAFDQAIVKERGGLDKALKTLALDLEPGTFPVEASDTIEAMGLRGRIFHFTSWGGYLIGRHFPRCTVFTDGRGNFTSEEKDVLVATHRPWEREEALEEAWRKYPFEILVFPAPVFPVLDWDRDRWVLVHRDDLAEVFLRRSPENEENLRRAIAWWRVLGIDAPDEPAAAEARYLRVLAEERLRRKEVQEALAEASVKAQDPGSPRRRAEGLFEGAHLLFEAGRYDLAARFFRKALEQGFRHSTCGLYLAWSLHLSGRDSDAREALKAHVLAPDPEGRPDAGPLKYGGQRVLESLARKLGVESPGR